MICVKVLFPVFCVEGLPKFLDFSHFVLIWWQTERERKKEILKLAGLQRSVYLDRLTIVSLIAGFDNIFNIN